MFAFYIFYDYFSPILHMVKLLSGYLLSILHVPIFKLQYYQQSRVRLARFLHRPCLD